MKLLFVIDNFGSGGAQRQMVMLARALTERGHHIEFFIYYPEYHYRYLIEEAGIRIHCVQKTSRFSIAPIVALRRIVRIGSFDLLLAFLDTPNFYAEIACLGLIDTKLIVSERSMYPAGRLTIVKTIFQQCHRLADYITVNSHHQRIRMETEFPWMKEKLETIYNGYDLDAFLPLPQSNIENHKLNLLAISSVGFKKNSLNLARALKICRDTHNLFICVDWVGAKHVSGDEMRPSEETDALLRESGLSDQWRWLGVRPDIQQLLASHDALIHPSFFEGLPNVVCEALASGRPVLASRICDHPMLVEEGVSGYLFDPSSPDDIARAILVFSQRSSSERIAMGQAGRRFAVEHLSIERYTNEYERIIEALIHKPKGKI